MARAQRPRRPARERFFLLLLHLHPKRFRSAYRDDLLSYFRAAWQDQAATAGLAGRVLFWKRTIRGVSHAV